MFFSVKCFVVKSVKQDQVITKDKKKRLKQFLNKSSKKSCPTKMVDNEVIKESEKEKYLGDYLTSKANSKDTIIARKAQGYGILGEITALLKDVPLGNRRTQIGLELRKAWFHNKCLFNSEVWSSVTDTDIKDLSIIDRKILRFITGSQAKVPVEMLHLETSPTTIFFNKKNFILAYNTEKTKRRTNQPGVLWNERKPFKR